MAQKRFLAAILVSILLKTAKCEINIAIVSFQPLPDENLSIQQKIDRDVASYLKILDELDPELNLIIYPGGILNDVKNINDEVIAIASILEFDDVPDDRYPSYMKDFSRAAQTHNISIVINIIEKEDCSSHIFNGNCKTFGYVFYDTIVAFDNNGAINERYRKRNLLLDNSLDRSGSSMSASFAVNSVSFGILTTYDLLLKTPAENFHKFDVNTIVPSLWYSEMPFLTSLQIHQMFAQEYDVALFVAGVTEPKHSLGGSGVFMGKSGTIYSSLQKIETYTFSFLKEEGTGMNLMNKHAAEETDSFVTKVDDTLSDYTSQLLNSSIKTSLCHENLCCDFSITITEDASRSSQDSYSYRLMVYQGSRNFTKYQSGGIEVCALVACLNSSVTSCGHRSDNVAWPWTFNEIVITANFTNDTNHVQFPNSLLNSLTPIAAEETAWTREDMENGLTRSSFGLKTEQKEVLTFAIYGRNFAVDDLYDPPKENSARAIVDFNYALLMLLLIKLII